MNWIISIKDDSILNAGYWVKKQLKTNMHNKITPTSDVKRTDDSFHYNQDPLRF